MTKTDLLLTLAVYATAELVLRALASTQVKRGRVMIQKTLVFADDDTHVALPSEALSVAAARDLVAICLRHEAYVFIRPDEVGIENYTLGCYTELRGPPAELALVVDGLTERLPPERAHSCWLEHLRQQEHH